MQVKGAVESYDATLNGVEAPMQKYFAEGKILS